MRVATQKKGQFTARKEDFEPKTKWQLQEVKLKLPFLEMGFRKAPKRLKA